MLFKVLKVIGVFLLCPLIAITGVLVFRFYGILGTWLDIGKADLAAFQVISSLLNMGAVIATIVDFCTGDCKSKCKSH